MRRNLLTTGAAAFVLACPGAFAATTASNDQFAVTTDWMGLFGDVSIADGVVSATSSFAGASASVIPMQVGSDFALSFQAAPGYVIDGYMLSMQVSGGADTYSGPAFGSAPAAYAAFSSSFGGAEFDGAPQSVAFATEPPPGEVGGSMSFYAFPSQFCIVPLAVCQDVPEDIVTLWSYANLDFFRVTPIIESAASPVSEPGVPGLLVLGVAGAVLRRRALSAPGTA